MSIIFGPINSRRFGKSLGVDLSPDIKQCNFDCLYCELKGAKVVDNYSKVLSVKEITKAIKEALKEHKAIDYLTITANGEPTLYPYLNELIDEINTFKGGIKTLILTNSGTIDNLETQEALSRFDSVKLSLDCATKDCFKRLDRASKSIDLDSIKKGMLEFKSKFSGNLLIEILFVEGLNDTKEEVAKLNEFLIKLNPTRVDLSTIDRPPAYPIKPISYSKLHSLSLEFSKKLNIAIASKQPIGGTKYNYTKEQILQTLSMRPLTLNDIEILFSVNSKNKFYELLRDNQIEKIENGDIEFYRANR